MLLVTFTTAVIAGVSVSVGCEVVWILEYEVFNLHILMASLSASVNVILVSLVDPRTAPA